MARLTAHDASRMNYPSIWCRVQWIIEMARL